MGESPIYEVIDFLSYCKAQAKHSGTLHEGNVPMNLQHLENALNAAKEVAGMLDGSKQEQDANLILEQLTNPAALQEQKAHPELNASLVFHKKSHSKKK